MEEDSKHKEDAKASVFSRINNQNVQVKLRQFKERTNSYITERSSSDQEHKVIALASGAEEGRD